MRKHLAPPVSGAAGYPLGFTTAVVVTTAAVAAHGAEHPQWTLVALTVCAVSVAAVTTLPAAAGTGAVTWALYAGFVVGRRGELVLSGPTGTAAVVLAAAVGTGYLVAVAVRHARHRPIDHGYRGIEGMRQEKLAGALF